MTSKVPCSSRNLRPTVIGQFDRSLVIAFFLGETKYLTVKNATWRPLAVFIYAGKPDSSNILQIAPANKLQIMNGLWSKHWCQFVCVSIIDSQFTQTGHSLDGSLKMRNSMKVSTIL